MDLAIFRRICLKWQINDLYLDLLLKRLLSSTLVRGELKKVPIMEHLRSNQAVVITLFQLSQNDSQASMYMLLMCCPPSMPS
jgi:hypothetical protein